MIVTRIYTEVQKIPIGKVATYGYIGQLAGIKSPRYVGTVLHRNPSPLSIPCHRVVNARGKLAEKFAFGGMKGQKKKLEQEGVEVQNNRVDLRIYQWDIESVPDSN